MKDEILSVAQTDANFPQRLKHIAFCPERIFYRGALEILHRETLLAVVGTRNMSSYGEEVVKGFIPELVRAGVVIVSGLAFGVDRAAHLACLRSGGLTVAVQAQGVDVATPRSNQPVYAEILSHGGCVLSEFARWQKDGFHPGTFPRRNRIISGLCDGVLVVEAPEKSGALITAEFALEQNRNVYAVPGSIYQKNQRGCLELLKMGAKPVSTPADILDELKITHAREKVLDVDVFESSLEKSIHALCAGIPRRINDIADAMNENISFVSAAITKMQLRGKLMEIKGEGFLAK